MVAGEADYRGVEYRAAALEGEKAREGRSLACQRLITRKSSV